MLKEWPSAEKPREKLISAGASSLTDAELLAIFLRTGVKGCHVVDLAKNLLQCFGSIGAIYKASADEFCQMHGLGLAKYVQLQACLEMTKRFLSEELNHGDTLTSSQSSKNFLIAQLRNETQEVFSILFLNNQHQVISFERLFYGTINASVVYPRIVVERALKHQASAVIFAHNHPSGIAKASLADKQITAKLQQALGLIDINVLDHMIVAGHICFSFAEHRLL
jgi:DNA repair protein RadC